MDYRHEAFRKKFAHAARQFGVKPNQLVSLKVRENVSSYSDYHELLRSLEREFSIQSKPIDADLQGKGYLLSDGKARVIMVEHETGLEILYVAGSIASLIGLVPIVLQGWRAIRGSFSNRHHGDVQNVETRRLDENGQLIEDRVNDMPFDISNHALESALKAVGNDLQQVMDQLQSLTRRVEVLEKRIVTKAKKSKKKSVARKKR